LVFGRLFRRAPESDAIAAAVYGAIVAQARHPALYADFGVADTVDGRFEMVVLHTVLVLDRLQGSEADRTAAQGIFDLFCTDMDRSLRELGVGDLGVPKRMKQMTERFYGRAAAYRAALAAADRPALADALSRNVFGGPAAGAAPLAAYVLASWEALAAAPGGTLLGQGPRFADPAGFAVVEASA
jgi:cytochrome b pre-mRNA-processing protein 3